MVQFSVVFHYQIGTWLTWPPKASCIVVTRTQGQSQSLAQAPLVFREHCPVFCSKSPEAMPRSFAFTTGANCGDMKFTNRRYQLACRIPDGCFQSHDHRRSTLPGNPNHFRSTLRGSVGKAFRWCCASGLIERTRNPGVRYGSARICSRSSAAHRSNRWQGRGGGIAELRFRPSSGAELALIVVV